jgi:hypothetical protein
MMYFHHISILIPPPPPPNPPGPKKEERFKNKNQPPFVVFLSDTNIFVALVLSLFFLFFFCLDVSTVEMIFD